MPTTTRTHTHSHLAVHGHMGLGSIRAWLRAAAGILEFYGAVRKAIEEAEGIDTIKTEVTTEMVAAAIEKVKALEPADTSTRRHRIGPTGRLCPRISRGGGRRLPFL